jgi:hypothetical protein
MTNKLKIRKINGKFHILNQYGILIRSFEDKSEAISFRKYLNKQGI